MSSSVQWPDRTLPVTISCAPGVLTSLEILAMDGLLAMPRIGLGVGGLLLGRRDEGRIEILRSVEIPCSHALGPSFMLTAAEMKALVALPESEDDGPTQVVGWYCSKTHRNLDLTEHDHRLFDSFCPESWQTLLLIHPAKGFPTRAAFGFREERVFKPGEWLDLAWQELSGFEKPSKQAPKAAVAAAAAAPAPAPPPPAAPAPPPPAPAIEDHPDVVPVAMPSTGTLFGNPGPASEVRQKRPKKKPQSPWKMNLVFAGILLVVLALIALLARGILGA
jgi:hypothetical protein